MYLLRIITIALIPFLVGCKTAEILQIQTPEPTAEAGYGYLAVLASRDNSLGYGFVVRSATGTLEEILPLGGDPNFPQAVDNKSSFVRLPPGTYSIYQWVIYSPLTKTATRHKLSERSQRLAATISIEAGHVVHLGAFDAFSYVFKDNNFARTQMNHWEIKSRRMSEPEVQTLFKMDFPSLGTLPFRCILCVDKNE